ncbi:MAG TPA: hypothetical protein PLB59_11585, partial [Bacteroidales bacterium]|nr:hypothetical protein [Bacteroidales bacterium]HQP16598.1 hypothetical protein [Bacteroidales bacterium]
SLIPKIMKTLHISRICAMLIAVLALAFTSCKKDKDPDTTTLQQFVSDENRVAAADDEIMKDINSVLSGSGQKATNTFPCNVTVDSSVIVGDTIIYSITFNGLNCSGRWNRVGQAEVRKHVNTHWPDAGATVYVKYLNVLFTRVSDNLTVTLNGKRIFTNVSGGRIINLGTTATSVVHRVTGSLIATFNDNTTRTWTIARLITYTGTIGNLWVTIDGFGSADGYNNLVVWGTNRSGELFYTQITQSVVRKESCNFDPCAGVKVHQIPADNKQATFTAGFDDNNLPVDVNGSACPTKYRIDWIWNGNSGTLYKYL